MNKITKYLFIATAALTLASCQEKPEPAPVFPEQATLGCAAGEQKTLSFTATHDWTLISDKLWCSFDTPVGNLQSLSGGRGEVNVTLNIGEEGLNFDNSSTCHISLTMGGQTVNYATITRSPKQFSFALYDLEGNEIQEVHAGYKTYAGFVAKANFTFAAVSWDGDVFTLKGDSMIGAGGEEVLGGLVVNQNGTREKYAIGQEAGYTLVFSDESGRARYSYPIVYDGMDPEEMEVFNIPGPAEQTFGWVLSIDGKTLSQDQHYGDGGTYVHPYSSYDFEVKCLNDDYTVFVSSTDGFNPDWVHVQKNGSKVRVTFDANADSKGRNAVAFAFPQALYESFGGTPGDAYNAIHPSADATQDEMDRAYRIENFCRALEVYQEFKDKYADDGSLTPVALRSDLGMDNKTGEFFCDPYIDIERIYPDDLFDTYNVTAVYQMTFCSGSGIFLLPMIDGFDISSYAGADGSADGEEFQITGDKVGTASFYYRDRSLTSDEYEPFDGLSEGLSIYGRKVKGFSFHITGPEDWTSDPIYAVFTLTNKDKRQSKLVVIYPPVNE